MQRTRAASYGTLLQQSWGAWKQFWWKLIIPDILGFLIGISILAFLVGIQIVIFIVLGWNILDFQHFIAQATFAHYSVLGVFLLLDLLLMLLVGAYFEGAKIGLVRDALTKKNVHLRLLWAYAVRYVWVVWKVRVLAFAAMWLPPLLIGTVVLSTILAFGPLRSWTALFPGIFFLLLLILYLSFAIIFFYFALFFMHPILAQFDRPPKAWNVLKMSLRYSTHHLARFFITFLIVIGITFAVGIALFVISLGIGLPLVLLAGGWILTVQVLWRILSFIAQLLLRAFTELFTYASYYTEK